MQVPAVMKVSAAVLRAGDGEFSVEEFELAPPPRRRRC